MHTTIGQAYLCRITGNDHTSIVKCQLRVADEQIADCLCKRIAGTVNFAACNVVSDTLLNAEHGCRVNCAAIKAPDRSIHRSNRDHGRCIHNRAVSDSEIGMYTGEYCAATIDVAIINQRHPRSQVESSRCRAKLVCRVIDAPTIGHRDFIKLSLGFVIQHRGNQDAMTHERTITDDIIAAPSRLCACGSLHNGVFSLDLNAAMSRTIDVAAIDDDILCAGERVNRIVSMIVEIAALNAHVLAVRDRHETAICIALTRMIQIVRTDLYAAFAGLKIGHGSACMLLKCAILDQHIIAIDPHVLLEEWPKRAMRYGRVFGSAQDRHAQTAERIAHTRLCPSTRQILAHELCMLHGGIASGKSNDRLGSTQRAVQIIDNPGVRDRDVVTNGNVASQQDLSSEQITIVQAQLSIDVVPLSQQYITMSSSLPERLNVVRPSVADSAEHLRRHKGCFLLPSGDICNHRAVLINANGGLPTLGRLDPKRHGVAIIRLHHGAHRAIANQGKAIGQIVMTVKIRKLHVSALIPGVNARVREHHQALITRVY